VLISEAANEALNDKEGKIVRVAKKGVTVAKEGRDRLEKELEEKLGKKDSKAKRTALKDKMRHEGFATREEANAFAKSLDDALELTDEELPESSTSWVEVEVEGKRELLELFVSPTKLADPKRKAWFPAAAEVSIVEEEKESDSSSSSATTDDDSDEEKEASKPAAAPEAPKKEVAKKEVQTEV
jgi:hypothetical protein